MQVDFRGKLKQPSFWIDKDNQASMATPHFFDRYLEFAQKHCPADIVAARNQLSHDVDFAVQKLVYALTDMTEEQFVKYTTFIRRSTRILPDLYITIPSIVPEGIRKNFEELFTARAKVALSDLGLDLSELLYTSLTNQDGGYDLCVRLSVNKEALRNRIAFEQPLLPSTTLAFVGRDF